MKYNNEIHEIIYSKNFRSLLNLFGTFLPTWDLFPIQKSKFFSVFLDLPYFQEITSFNSKDWISDKWFFITFCNKTPTPFFNIGSSFVLNINNLELVDKHAIYFNIF